MPGPMHKSPRNPGPRLDPEGNDRKPNRKAAKKLARRIAAFEANERGDAGFHRPGSQNRNKS